MIKNSFVFLDRVGGVKEKRWWDQGIHTWQDFLLRPAIKGVSTGAKLFYDSKIREAQKALQEENSVYFVGKMPSREMWRLYDYFKDDCCFLDVEVDSRGKIVVVGIAQENRMSTFVQGVNLEKVYLEKELMCSKLMITFNGAAFDLPRLKKQLKIEFSLPHIDLKPLCARLGLTGGLKEVENVLHLKRPGHLYGNPVELWKAFHASGDREYLDLLLEYNREDCENLRGVMNVVYKRMKEKILEKLLYQRHS